MTNPHDISTLDGWNAHVKYMEERAPGFWEANPPRVIIHMTAGKRCYQFGYEIAGYGTIIGHCRHHKRHATPESAFLCGHRFLSGKPPLWRYRLPWMKEDHQHE